MNGDRALAVCMVWHWVGHACRAGLSLSLWQHVTVTLREWQCLQDHNYVAPLPCTPPLSPQGPPSPAQSSGGTAGLGGVAVDDTGSTTTTTGIKEVVVTTTTGDPVGDDSVTRCICDFQHDDGYMICCDQCGSVSPSHTTLKPFEQLINVLLYY